MSSVKNINITKTNNSNSLIGPSGQIVGSNNGSWGFGMYGASFPVNMNGPLGSFYRPLPNNVDEPTLLNGPKYNAKRYNGPDYNQQAFVSISGYTFDKFAQDVPDINTDTTILFIKPSIG